MAEAVQRMESEQQVDNRAPIIVLRDKLMSRQGELRAALTDVSVESFIRAVMTSVALNSEILGCSWQSIWNSCLRACRDGLLPDGVDAALVPFKGTCSYIPMYQGMLRRFRRSGNFKWITAGIVRQGEEFSHWIDEEGEHFRHTPGDNFKSPIVKIYALATTKDGGVFCAVLPIEEANKIRSMSKASRDDSPWRMWEEEMYKKTALRRLSKVLPSARDLAVEEPPEFEEMATIGGADTELPRITGEQQRGAPQTGTIAGSTSPRAALDQFAGSEPGPGSEATQQATQQARQHPESLLKAHSDGKDARAAGVQRRALPGELRDEAHQAEAAAWLAGWDGQPI